MSLEEFKKRKDHLEQSISDSLTDFCKAYTVEPADITFTIHHVSTMDAENVELLRVKVDLKFEL